MALKALAKRPDDRFQSAGEMAEMLSAAAKETGIEVPETISLPQGISTSSSTRTGPVAVFSGPARQQIPDAGFASGDTDITFGKNSRTGLTKVTDQVKDLFTPPAKYDKVAPKHVTAAALYSRRRDRLRQYGPVMAQRDLWLESIWARLAAGNRCRRWYCFRP